MSEVVERIAGRIGKYMLENPLEGDLKELARLVLEEMRPTEDELRKAGCDDDSSGAPYCADCSYLAGQFGLLIDAALK